MGVTVQAVDTGDTPSMVETLILATEPLDVVRVDALGIEAGVGDQGSHSNEMLTALKALGLRSYSSEPDRGRRCWKGRAAARDALYGNRRRNRGAGARRVLRCKGALLERPRAHACDRREAAGPPPRASEQPQAAARAVCWMHPWAAVAAAERCGHAAEPAGSRCGCILHAIPVVECHVGPFDATPDGFHAAFGHDRLVTAPSLLLPTRMNRGDFHRRLLAVIRRRPAPAPWLVAAQAGRRCPNW